MLRKSFTLTRTLTLAMAVTTTAMVWGLAATAQTVPNLPPRSLLQVGATGNDVSDLQGVLSLMGLYDGTIDGVFSQGTLNAVKRFQEMAGLGTDGIVGAATWAKLLPPAPGEAPVAVTLPATAVTSTTPTPTQPPIQPEVGEPILRKGAEGTAVSALQRRLRAIGVYNGMIDGGFGEETEEAVKAAQRRAGLEEDGIVGPATWNAIR
jgi:N-acetylmuramoyl-L-alanine amidase